MDNLRLIAFDLDGTLTQHKTKLAQPNLGVLNALRAKYKLLMVGAGMCSRIFSQMNGYPIDIIGNYGMQFCTYNAATGELDHVFDEHAPCDRASVEARVTALRERFGYTVFKGNNVEYHDSGCVTFPLLGTAADITDKLAFDRYCTEYGYDHSEIVYVGDDYGPGGNDEAVYRSDFRFIRVDDYTRFGEYMKEFL